MKRSFIIYKGIKYFQQRSGHYAQSGKQGQLHRKIWVDNFGAIPKGKCVHHIDGDPENNELANLSLVDPALHQSFHSRMFWEVRKTTNKKCLICGKDFQTYWKNKTKYCSKNCNQKSHYRRAIEKRTCPICSKIFSVYKQRITKCCSRSCGFQLRNRNKK